MFFCSSVRPLDLFWPWTFQDHLYSVFLSFFLSLCAKCPKPPRTLNSIQLDRWVVRSFSSAYSLCQPFHVFRSWDRCIRFPLPSLEKSCEQCKSLAGTAQTYRGGPDIATSQLDGFRYFATSTPPMRRLVSLALLVPNWPCNTASSKNCFVSPRATSVSLVSSRSIRVEHSAWFPPCADSQLLAFLHDDIRPAP